MRNEFADRIKKAYQGTIRQKECRIASKRWEKPPLDYYATPAAVFGVFGGLIGSFIFMEALDSWFLALIVSALGSAGLVMSVYAAKYAAVWLHNRKLKKKTENIIRKYEMRMAEELDAYDQDIKMRSNEIVKQYNRDRAPSPIFDWMNQLWARAIRGAYAPNTEMYIDPGLRYTVYPDRIEAQISVGTGNAWSSSEYLLFKDQHLAPLTESEEEYECLVECAAYARFLYKKARFELIGTESREGLFCYPPGQDVKIAENRADLVLEYDRYPFFAEGFQIRYRAKNPNYVGFVRPY